MATRWVTDETLREAIGDAKIDPEKLGQALDDVRVLHAFVVEDPWLTDAALRSAAEKEGLDPDRVNAALAVLTSSGQIYPVNLTERQIPERSPEAEVGLVER